MNARLEELLADLVAESEQLDAWLVEATARSGEQIWGQPTPAAGWSIAHQVAHLMWTDETSVLAITDVAGFAEATAQAQESPATFVDDAASTGTALAPADLLARWRAGRVALVEALRSCPDDTRIPWFGPPMAPASMATARIMETWAHAHDVAQALGVEVPRTHRARHVAFLGVRTRDFAHQVRGMAPPAEEFRVELTDPDGDLWAFGPPDATESVKGDGWDFALVATRRLHREDADLVAVGEQAERWLTIVQAFAGHPGADPGRRGGERSTHE